MLASAPNLTVSPLSSAKLCWQAGAVGGRGDSVKFSDMSYAEKLTIVARELVDEALLNPIGNKPYHVISSFRLDALIITLRGNQEARKDYSCQNKPS